MEIPLGVAVVCAGKACGRSTALVLNPVTDEVTHVVIREEHSPHEERLVPTGRIGRAEGGELVLNATREELEGMDPFEETHFIRSTVDRYVPGSAYTWPYVMHAKEPVYLVKKEERIPAGEVAVHRGARVIATDGSVGEVDEFLVSQEGRHVTHLVMREGHLWGKRDVAIPVSQVDRMSEETVYLKLSRKGVEGLPLIPVRRTYGGRPQGAEK